MRCVAPVPRTCVSPGLHASFAPMAKCATQFVNGSRFEFRCSVLIKRAAHLAKCKHIWSNVVHLAKCARIWPNIAHLAKCRAFYQLVRCAAHLAKCALHSHRHGNSKFKHWLGKHCTVKFQADMHLRFLMRFRSVPQTRKTRSICRWCRVCNKKKILS